MMGLHIFEPRYREMIRDVSAGHGMFVVSLMRDDGFHQVGTIGRIRELEPLGDGRFNLRLAGLERVDVIEVPSTRPYRLVHPSLRPDGATPTGPEAESAHLDLLGSLGLLMRVVRMNGGDEAPGQGADDPILLDGRMSFADTVNAACAALPIDAGIRQAMLEENDLLLRQRRASDEIQEVLGALLSLGASKQVDPDETELN
jgi:Lon protease-like protein